MNVRLIPAALLLPLSLGRAAPAVAAAGTTTLPLPDAPVVLLVEDVGALDRALGGGMRKAVTGTLPESDPAGVAWRRTRVGGKLEAQWALFAKDLPLAWDQIVALKPTSLGLSLLAVGDLEAVLAVATPLAELPVKIPAGTAKQHRGVTYRLVSPGAGDVKTGERRMGLAWARTGGVLLLATSERALLLALDRSLAGETASTILPGLAQVRLDLDALRKDLYFRREFLFAEGTRGPSRGELRAALRLEGERLVEVREGATDESPGAASWPISGRSIRAAGWETDATRLLPALRGALLEPVPSPEESPGTPRTDLPLLGSAYEDRYAVDFTRSAPAPGETGSEAELPRWRALLAEAALTGFGWELGRDGSARLLLKLPRSLDQRFATLVEETVARRAGAVTASESGSVSVGPSLPAVAFRRTGDWLWVGGTAEELAALAEPASGGDLTRWGRLDLTDLESERARWAEAEGTFSPDRSRPFSDRLLGLLGWTPNLAAVASERRVKGPRFTERVVFETRPPPPPKPPAPPRTAASGQKKGA